MSEPRSARSANSAASPEHILRDSRGPHDIDPSDLQIDSIQQRSRTYTDGTGSPRVNKHVDFKDRYQSNEFLDLSWKAVVSSLRAQQVEKHSFGSRKKDLCGPAEELLQDLFMSPDEWTAKEEAEKMEFFANSVLQEVWKEGAEDEDMGWLDQYDGGAATETMEFMDDVDVDDSSIEDTDREDEGVEKGMTLAEFVSPEYARVAGNDIDPDTVLSPIIYSYHPEAERGSDDSLRTTSTERYNSCAITESEVDDSQFGSDSQVKLEAEAETVSDQVGIQRLAPATILSDEELENATNLQLGLAIRAIEEKNETNDDIWLKRPLRIRDGDIPPDTQARNLLVPETIPIDMFPSADPSQDGLFEKCQAFERDTSIRVGKEARKFKLPGSTRGKTAGKTMTERLGDLEEKFDVLTRDQKLRDDELFELSQVNQKCDPETTKIIDRLERKVDSIDKNVEYLNGSMRSLSDKLTETQVMVQDTQQQGFEEQNDLISTLLALALDAQLNNDREHQDWYDQALWPQGDPESTLEEDSNQVGCIIL